MRVTTECAVRLLVTTTQVSMVVSMKIMSAQLPCEEVWPDTNLGKSYTIALVSGQVPDKPRSCCSNEPEI